MHSETMARDMPGRVCAALVTVRGRMLLILGGEDRWRHDPGCVFIPLELPGGVCPEDASPAAAIAAIGQRWLGCPLRLLPAEITYGRSAQHAIDRLPLQAAPAPLLALERFIPADDPERGSGLQRLSVEVFCAARSVAASETDRETGGSDDTAGIEPQEGCSGALLLSWQALRQIVRGLPLADLLARDDVTLRLRPGITLPPEGLVYLTGEYGERMLLRVAAKYGVRALGKDIDHGTGF
ncbi:MAG TPA: hypothetical protein VF040_00105 [Ktedonobacterales bacterium]